MFCFETWFPWKRGDLEIWPWMLWAVYYAKLPDHHSRGTLRGHLCQADLQGCSSIFVRTYVFHMLRTYVIILCNWLILWQNALYLYLGRFRMCLILQETCCSSLELKPWRLDKETSEEKLFIKAGQIARQLLDTCGQITRHLLIAGGSIEKAPVSSTAPQ